MLNNSKLLNSSFIEKNFNSYVSLKNKFFSIPKNKNKLNIDINTNISLIETASTQSYYNTNSNNYLVNSNLISLYLNISNYKEIITLIFILNLLKILELYKINIML
jgi:hypothetical protein